MTGQVVAMTATTVWTVPARHGYDPPRIIAIDMPCTTTDFSGSTCRSLVTTGTARAIAKALVEEADYADRCVVTPHPTQEA